MTTIPDRTIQLNDGNTIELRRIDLDGKVTLGVRVIDKNCGLEAAVEVDDDELIPLTVAMRAVYTIGAAQ